MVDFHTVSDVLDGDGLQQSRRERDLVAVVDVRRREQEVVPRLVGQRRRLGLVPLLPLRLQVAQDLAPRHAQLVLRDAVALLDDDAPRAPQSVGDAVVGQGHGAQHADGHALDAIGDAPQRDGRLRADGRRAERRRARHGELRELAVDDVLGHVADEPPPESADRRRRLVALGHANSGEGRRRLGVLEDARADAPPRRLRKHGGAEA